MYIKGLQECFDIEITETGGDIFIFSPQCCLNYMYSDNLRRGIIEKVLNIKQ